MFRPGDVVKADFVGATGVKRRPVVVLSSALYHQHRPDLILGVLTTQLRSATTPLDYVLLDWAVAGLHQSSAFRPFFDMNLPANVTPIGRLSDRDWRGVQVSLSRALGLPSPP